MKKNRKERRRLRKEKKKVFLADLESLGRAAKRAGGELDDLSKVLRSNIIPAGTDCGKSTILPKLLGWWAAKQEELKHD